LTNEINSYVTANGIDKKHNMEESKDIMNLDVHEDLKKES